MATWVGGTSGDWNTGTNWDSGSAPGNGDVTIAAGVNVTLDANTTINSVVISPSAGELTFSGAYTLQLSTAETLAAGSGISLASGTHLALSTGVVVTGTGTASLEGGVITESGSVTLSSGQTLLLKDTSFSSVSQISGAGTIELDGTYAYFQYSAPTTTIQFDTVKAGGKDNTLSVPNYASGLTLTNLGYGDLIYAGGDTLALVSNGDGTYRLVDTHNGNYTSTLSSHVTLEAGVNVSDFTMSNGYFVYAGAAPCFYAGTMIATPDGEKAVEDLAAGDLVLTADGKAVPVRWLGQSRVSTRFADAIRAFPIRIKAGALAEGVPARDLLVSPDHAVFLQGVLVQAGALVNGSSITRESDVPDYFTYYHVELATHELILADGALAESFVDNVDRMNFQNWQSREVPAEPIVEMDYPRAKAARQVPASIRRELAALAEAFEVREAA